MSPQFEINSDSQRKKHFFDLSGELPQKNLFAHKIKELNQSNLPIKQEHSEPKTKFNQTTNAEQKIEPRIKQQKRNTRNPKNKTNRKLRKTDKRGQTNPKKAPKENNFNQSEEPQPKIESGLMHKSFLKYSQNTSRLGVRRSHKTQRTYAKAEDPSQKIQCKEEFDEEHNDIKIEEISVDFTRKDRTSEKKQNVVEMYKRASEKLHIQKVFNNVEEISKEDFELQLRGDAAILTRRQAPDFLWEFEPKF